MSYRFKTGSRAISSFSIKRTELRICKNLASSITDVILFLATLITSSLVECGC